MAKFHSQHFCYPWFDVVLQIDAANTLVKMTTLFSKTSAEKTTDFSVLSAGAESLLSGLTNSLFISSTKAQLTDQATSKGGIEVTKINSM